MPLSHPVIPAAARKAPLPAPIVLHPSWYKHCSLSLSAKVTEVNTVEEHASCWLVGGLALLLRRLGRWHGRSVYSE
jgi:hypothetical protein